MESNSTLQSVTANCQGSVASGISKNGIPIHYAVLLLVASSFLLFTAIIFLLQWKKQNIYSWTIFCEVLAMFFMIFFVAIAHTFAREPGSGDYGSAHCVFIGASAHFFYLSTFFWLVVINFDLWWTFRRLKLRTKSSGWLRFILYQFFGWGIPLLIVVVGLVMDRLYGVKMNPDCSGSIIVPNYGQLNCYISKAAQGPYLFYPMGFILAGNLMLYILTVVSVYNQKRGTDTVLQAGSTNQTKAMSVFVKLFIVMGVAWIAEILAWSLHTPTDKRKSKVPWYWIIFDLVILLQSLAIFFMFVCKRQVLSDLWQTYPSMRPFLTPISRLPYCGIISEERILPSRQQRTMKLPASPENVLTVTPL